VATLFIRLFKQFALVASLVFGAAAGAHAEPMNASFSITATW
jgi:hypothetical protein